MTVTQQGHQGTVSYYCIGTYLHTDIKGPLHNLRQTIQRMNGSTIRDCLEDFRF